MIKFQWNETKAVANFKKHKVSFEEARSVFYDEFAIQFFDDENSDSEDRFILLGLSSESRILVVCHCERSVVEKDKSETIRIISARKATKNERSFYQGEAS